MSVRTVNSAKNLMSSIAMMTFSILVGFFTRKIFVDSIGVEYLGLNGLLSNILGVMTLLESGFSASVIYNMYKPMANDDRPRIIALVQLYKKVYRYIAIAVFVVALAIYPFLGIILKDSESLQNVTFVYFIFVLNTLIPYFTAYRWSVINVSQQYYKLTAINMINLIVLNALKVVVLLLLENYIAFLLVETTCAIGLNIAVTHKCNKLFPYLKTKIKHKVEPEVRKNIITNMKAIFLHALGGYFMHSTDNIVISSFVGVAIVGFYSNYTLLTSTLSQFLSQALTSMSDSVGNLIAKEDKDHIYDVFKSVLFINFILTSFGVVMLSTTLQPFISWWLGSEYLLSSMALIIILTNYYLYGMRSAPYTFKTKAGIFTADRFTPLMQGIINLCLSLLLVRKFGLTGVLGATAISIICISWWQWPRLVYKHVFHKPLRRYFKRYFLYTGTMLLSIGISQLLCHLVVIPGFNMPFIINAIITFGVYVGTYYLVFRHLSEYKILLEYIELLKIRIKGRFVKTETI